MHRLRDQYDVSGVIGQGGFAAVYSARRKSDKLPVRFSFIRRFVTILSKLRTSTRAIPGVDCSHTRLLGELIVSCLVLMYEHITAINDSTLLHGSSVMCLLSI